MSVKVIWNAGLAADYMRLWKAATINSNKVHLVDAAAKRILANKARYEAISAKSGVPWWFIGLLHHMECGLRFNAHLHNGDSLNAKTVRVPAGRPLAPQPTKVVNGETVLLPYDFDVSALDALNLMGLTKNKDWSLAYALYRLEGFNGYGYRQYHPTVASPYLWSFTSVYTKGKYVADGKWNGETVSEQVGIAAILKAMKIFP